LTKNKKYTNNIYKGREIMPAAKKTAKKPAAKKPAAKAKKPAAKKK
jgi:hypothetical protein